MKMAIAFLVLTLSFGAFAKDQAPCKIEAHSAAAELYQHENPGTGFSLRAKFKPVQQDKVVYHMVEIVDFEGGQKTNMTVSLNPKTCAVLSID
nr:hypothetical protein BHI3_15800 [Bacteriovorax sp. HI3]